MPSPIAGSGKQLPRFFDRRGRIGLIAQALRQPGFWGGEFREGIDKTSHQHGGDLFHHFHQDGFVEHQMHGPAYTRVVKRFAGVVDPHRLNDALIIIRARHALRALHFFQAHRVEEPGIIDSTGEERGAELRRKGREMVEFNAIEVGQAIVPIVRMPLHNPHFFVDAFGVLERASPWEVHDLPQVVIVVLQASFYAR